ncbi:hypothetical protein L9F63_008451, partial [Diploptera punctata]
QQRRVLVQPTELASSVNRSAHIACRAVWSLLIIKIIRDNIVCHGQARGKTHVQYSTCVSSLTMTVRVFGECIFDKRCLSYCMDTDSKEHPYNNC